MNKKRIALVVILVILTLISLFLFVVTLLQNHAAFAVLSLLASQFGTWAIVGVLKVW